ncbi:hypothetical protein M011DRAFT_511752 [Sporormia fimetaria CBS 119925]|uniref:Probable double zinc ribbon domain-containing protein n=1 Tax=Sporormia fimetaria CBS 119925 TaxID=1340428 RepID=A0A6A6VKQ9_9PLEO|nr:hypothetical protein M011DRAFT_511752 [Sporormia fimetaria CBS 119925]
MAKRANAPTDRTCYFDLEYANIQRLTTDGADGAWWCCKCNHENTIIEYEVFCKQCCVTDVVQQIDLPNRDEMKVGPLLSNSVFYGSICQDCGVSFRADPVRRRLGLSKANAVRFHTVCECGNNTWWRWLHFAIGDNQDWRLTPGECYARAVEQRAEKAVAHMTARMRADTYRSATKPPTVRSETVAPVKAKAPFNEEINRPGLRVGTPCDTVEGQVEIVLMAECLNTPLRVGGFKRLPQASLSSMSGIWVRTHGGAIGAEFGAKMSGIESEGSC